MTTYCLWASSFVFFTLIMMSGGAKGTVYLLAIQKNTFGQNLRKIKKGHVWDYFANFLLSSYNLMGHHEKPTYIKLRGCALPRYIKKTKKKQKKLDKRIKRLQGLKSSLSVLTSCQRAKWPKMVKKDNFSKKFKNPRFFLSTMSSKDWLGSRDA